MSNLEKKVRITGASIASLHQVSKQAISVVGSFDAVDQKEAVLKLLSSLL